MKLKIVRDTFTDKSTIGSLYIDDVFVCYTLEDVVREDGVKIYGETAIPEGIYSVTLSWSNRFKKVLPLIYNQPDLSVQSGGVRFDGIRIHNGNTDKDTHGCPLVGFTKSKDFIGNSRKAFGRVMELLKDIDIVELEIINQR